MIPQAGDVAGRFSTAVPWVPAFGTLLCMTLVVVLTSSIFIAAAAGSTSLPK